MSQLPFALPCRPASSPSLVAYVLVAEFDIDKGSTVRHCYPDTSIMDSVYTSDYFANNMLPEGAHNRSHDWTYMLLHRNFPQLDEVTDQVDVLYPIFSASNSIPSTFGYILTPNLQLRPYLKVDSCYMGSI